MVIYAIPPHLPKESCAIRSFGNRHSSFLSRYLFSLFRSYECECACAYVKHANRFDHHICSLIGWGVSANQYIHGRWSKIFAFVCTLHLISFFNMRRGLCVIESHIHIGRHRLQTFLL